MGNFYCDKMKADKTIQKLIESETPVQTILMNIEDTYGFGKLYLKKRIISMLERGELSKDSYILKEIKNV